MKNNIIFLLVILSFASCKSGYKVKIKLDNIPEQSFSFERINPDKNEIISESKVGENGVIEITGDAAEANLYIVKFTNENKLVLVLDKNDNAVITGDWNRFGDYKVEGSEGSNHIKTLLVQLREFIRDANTMDKISTNLKDTPKKDSLISAIQTDIRQKNKLFTAYVKRFADTVSIAPCAIFAANLLNRKVEGDYILHFYETVGKRFPNSQFVKDNIAHVSSELNEIKSSTQTAPVQNTAKPTEKKSSYVRPANTQLAPAISLTTPEGASIQLSDFKGKFVLVDFWASWCGPCRNENPSVVKAYQQFKDKNFDIFGISLDDDKDNWIAAIQQDNLTWKHGSDLKKWSSIPARDYNVQGIPMNFLVDPDGYIIASGLRGIALEQKLQEVLQ